MRPIDKLFDFNYDFNLFSHVSHTELFIVKSRIKFSRNSSQNSHHKAYYNVI